MIKYILIEDERFAYEEVKRMMKKLRADYQMSGWAVSIEPVSYTHLTLPTT